MVHVFGLSRTVGAHLRLPGTELCYGTRHKLHAIAATTQWMRKTVANMGLTVGAWRRAQRQSTRQHPIGSDTVSGGMLCCIERALFDMCRKYALVYQVGRY